MQKVRMISCNTFFGAIFFAIYLGLIAIGLMNSIYATSAKTDLEGKCASTPAKAVGSVLEVLSHSQVKLAFSSGVIETYPIDKLEIVNCP